MNWEKMIGEPADYLCDHTYREVIDNMKTVEPYKLVGLYNEFLQTPMPAIPTLSELTVPMVTLGLLSSALYETKIDRSVIKGSPVGGLGVIITRDNDVENWDFHNFQMAYATFEPGTGRNCVFNRRSGFDMIARGNAVHGARFYNEAGMLAQIGIGSEQPSTVRHGPLALWGADFGDKVVRRYL